MIYTLTTNPAIDMNISTMGIKRKEVNRTFEDVYKRQIHQYLQHY